MLFRSVSQSRYQTQSTDTLKKISDSNKITLAYHESSVPFNYLTSPNKPVNMSIEISEAIAAEVKKTLNKPNLEIAWQAVTSQNRIPLLTNGTINLECNSTTNNSTRGKKIQFTINYFYTNTHLLTKKNSNIKNYTDLKNKTISTTTDTTNFQILHKYNQNKYLPIVTGKQIGRAHV